MSADTMAVLFRVDMRDIQHGTLLGILLALEGDFGALLVGAIRRRIPEPGMDALAIHAFVVAHESTWTPGPWPWVVRALLGAIDDKRTVLVEADRGGIGFRREAARARKALRSPWAPPPFYVVTLREKLRVVGPESGERTGAPHHAPGYRYDVRGHERLRVARGWLPLDAGRQRGLERRRYRVYVGDLDDWAGERLGIKGLPHRQAGEWIAILSTRVKPHQRGPEDGPLVPAVRRVHA
jgi:hypothetical protein